MWPVRPKAGLPGLMRIVQISDTHLSQNKPRFFDNWPPLAAWIVDQHPDLVIHTGDMTFDGAGLEADLSFSAHLMDEPGIRWRVVPGNHDVGDARDACKPVTPSGLALGSVISARIAGSKMWQKVRTAGALSDSTRC